MGIEQVLGGADTAAIVCNQWGDTGKGKFVDVLAGWADIIARGRGGANAGHTLNINGREMIFHLIPSGILHDKDGKVNILGRGMALDPELVDSELEFLIENKVSYDHLMISKDANILLPQHKVMDRVRESSEMRIGTTGKGIGPFYTDIPARKGITMWQMLNKDLFAEKLALNLKDKVQTLRTFDPEIVKEVMHQDDLMAGIFYHPKKIFDMDTIIGFYSYLSFSLREMVRDTDSYLRQALGKKKIALEGAQGLLLSRDYGSIPYVTSSDPSIRELATGAGISEKYVGKTFGIVKAYMTRVGDGPFPTEYGGKESEDWCRGKKRPDEAGMYDGISLNDSREFKRGIAIRGAGKEYGATTDRLRRTGRLDLPLLRYATQFNGHDAILTKLDILSGMDEIEICDRHAYEGPRIDLGDKVLTEGAVLETAIPHSDILMHCRPVYRKMKGWKEDISGARRFEDLPLAAQEYVRYIAIEGDVNIDAISVGPRREDTIFMD